MKLFNQISISILALIFSHHSMTHTFPKNQTDAVQESIEIIWDDLESIEYKMRFFKPYDAEMSTPLFGEKQKALDGKKIIITGFVIPLEENTDLLSLAANPYASCFFCGNASPASVMSLYMKDSGKRYMIDDFKTFTGMLRLNYNNPDEFIYYLENAEDISD